MMKESNGTLGSNRREPDWAKRSLDIVASTLGLVLLAPVLGVIALAVRWTMGTPVLFRQPRPGLNERPFVIYKFRTMSDARDEHGRLLDDAQRLGRLGSFLRKSSLDELPELYNVLKGEMSLVGPRPLRVEYLDRYTPEQRRRHTVMPGITGWAQINGRNALTWEKKFQLDLWYVAHRSLWLDLKILVLTVAKVFKPEGITLDREMHEFKGTLLTAGNGNGTGAGSSSRGTASPHPAQRDVSAQSSRYVS